MKNLQNVTTTDCVIHFGGLGKGQERENYDEYCQTTNVNIAKGTTDPGVDCFDQ